MSALGEPPPLQPRLVRTAVKSSPTPPPWTVSTASAGTATADQPEVLLPPPPCEEATPGAAPGSQPPVPELATPLAPPASGQAAASAPAQVPPSAPADGTSEGSTSTGDGAPSGCHDRSAGSCGGEAPPDDFWGPAARPAEPDHDKAGVCGPRGSGDGVGGAAVAGGTVSTDAADGERRDEKEALKKLLLEKRKHLLQLQMQAMARQLAQLRGVVQKRRSAVGFRPAVQVRGKFRNITLGREQMLKNLERKIKEQRVCLAAAVARRQLIKVAGRPAGHLAGPAGGAGSSGSSSSGLGGEAGRSVAHVAPVAAAVPQSGGPVPASVAEQQPGTTGADAILIDDSDTESPLMPPPPPAHRGRARAAAAEQPRQAAPDAARGRSRSRGLSAGEASDVLEVL